MLASQQFCVKWNSYSTNLQNVFPRLLTSEHFVDITLACEGQMIKCHKVVLSACSTYFEKLLVQNPCQHPIIFMKDMKHWEVQALVDFMYKGEVNVSQDELSSLLVAAEALQIRGLCGSDHMGRGTALPQDTVLSGSGRESPASKRKRVDDSPQTSSRPSCQSTSTTKLSNSDSDIVTSLEQTQDENCEITETEMPERKPIKQEVDIDENFGDDGLENDRSQEHYANHEAQDDSDSKEQPQSPRDQPGPSGLPPNQTLTADKAATDLGAAMALQNVMCVLSGSPTNSGKVMPFGFSDGKDLHPSIPSPSTRIRRSEEELQKAAECVQKGMTFQNVSDIFNIPISTIRFYMARRGILPQRRRGRVSHSGQSSLQSNQTQPPSYMLLHYKLPDIGATKRTN